MKQFNFSKHVEILQENKHRIESGTYNCIPFTEKFPRLSTYLPGIIKGTYYITTANSGVKEKSVIIFGFLPDLLYLYVMKITKEKFAKSGIYIITCLINKKNYIGSSKNIYQRLMKHRSMLRNNKHENIILQNCYNKYKENNFDINLLEEIKDLTILTKKEQYYIDVINPILNITKKVERNELSESSKLKISNTLKEIYSKKDYVSPSNKAVDKYDLKGKFIKSYKSLKDASIDNNIHVSSIIRCLNGTYKQVKSTQWCYKESTKTLHTDFNQKRKYFLKKFLVVNTKTKKSYVIRGVKHLESFFNINHYTTLFLYIKNNKLYRKYYLITHLPL